MRNTLIRSTRGAIDLALIAVIAGAVVLGGALWKISGLHVFNSGPSAAKVAAETRAVGQAQDKVDAAAQTVRASEQKIQAEQVVQTRQGQSFVAATGEALRSAPPAVQADPSVKLAGRLNDKAAGALEQAVGPLTAEQLAWVSQLIRDATSASEERRAAAEQSFRASDAALRESASREHTALAQARAAQEQVDRLTSEKRTLESRLSSTLAEKSALGEFADQLLRWGLYLGLAYLAIAYLLPLVCHAFPILAPFAAAGHAILAPLAAKAKSEAEHLARDASAAAYQLSKLIADKAPHLAAEAREIKAAWITEADGTAVRHEAALRSANVL